MDIAYPPKPPGPRVQSLCVVSGSLGEDCIQTRLQEQGQGGCKKASVREVRDFGTKLFGTFGNLPKSKKTFKKSREHFQLNFIPF